MNEPIGDIARLPFVAHPLSKRRRPWPATQESEAIEEPPIPHVRMPEFAVDVPAYTAGSDAALVEAGRRLSQFWEWSMALPDSLDDATDDATEKVEDAAHSAINDALEDFFIKTPAHGAAGILPKYELLRNQRVRFNKLGPHRGDGSINPRGVPATGDELAENANTFNRQSNCRRLDVALAE